VHPKRPKPNRPRDPGVDSPLSVAVASRDRDVIAMVERAVSAGDALLAYQPVVAAGRPGAPAFYEGLIRILDLNGRIIPAGEFMGAVETRELGRRVDCLTLEHGLRVLRDQPNLRLSLNMSARSIGYPRWQRLLESGLSEPGGLGERLILEISEASAMLMPDIVQVFMTEMQERGVTFAIDDFGTGTVSLRHLSDMYFDIMKIDGSLSRQIAQSPENQVLIRAMLSLARHFEMITVAESVETAEDAGCLQRMGVDCLQGYLFGAPTIRPRWAPDRVMPIG